MAAVPPLLRSIFKEADAIAPNRSRATDGAIRTRQGPPSDHYADGRNPGMSGFVHAVDVTHDPKGGFDSYAEADMLVARCKAGEEQRVKYVVSYNAAEKEDRIASPVQNWAWRLKGTHDHSNHIHISIYSGEEVELSTAPMLRPAVPGPSPVEEGPVSSLPVMHPPEKVGPIARFGNRVAFYTHNTKHVIGWNSAALGGDQPYPPATNADTANGKGARYLTPPLQPTSTIVGLSYLPLAGGQVDYSRVVVYASDGATFVYVCT